MVLGSPASNQPATPGTHLAEVNARQQAAGEGSGEGVAWGHRRQLVRVPNQDQARAGPGGWQGRWAVGNEEPSTP